MRTCAKIFKKCKKTIQKGRRKNHNLLIHCMGKFCGATLDKAYGNPTIVRWGLFRWHTYGVPLVTILHVVLGITGKCLL